MAKAEKWVPVIDRLLWQCYYRIFSFISFHGPIDEAYEAASILARERGGEVYWVAEGRVFRWDSVTVSPDITMNVWFFGSGIRRRNTVMARVGWWKLWVVEAAVKLLRPRAAGSEPL